MADVRADRRGRRRFIHGLVASGATLGLASLSAGLKVSAGAALGGPEPPAPPLRDAPPGAPGLPSEAQLKRAFSLRSAEAVFDTLFPNGRPPHGAPETISLSLPEIAEDGSVVPLTLEFDAPCYGLVLIAAANPVPLVLASEFPQGALPPFRTRIRLAGSTTVTAVVFGARGATLARREVEVARGGCVQQAPAGARP